MKKKQVLGVIPARFGSSRFPGKPLADILGKSLIQRTYENAALCPSLDLLVVATDHEAIYEHVLKFGGHAIMTSSNAPTGTDRIAEVLQKTSEYSTAEIVVNIQGDWPLLDPKVITAVAKLLLDDPEGVMSTALVPIDERADLTSPHFVKCVCDQLGNALYFSRAPIPYSQGNKGGCYYKHLGIYGYRAHFLPIYASLPPTPLQLTEDLEQLKALEHGFKIKTTVVEHFTIGVDTPDDVKKVEQILCARNSSL